MTVPAEPSKSLGSSAAPDSRCRSISRARLAVNLGALSVGSSLAPRAHRETNLVFASLRSRVNDQREIAFSERRQRKFNPHAAPVVAGGRVVGCFGSALDRGLHLRPCLRLSIGSPHNFHVERHVGFSSCTCIPPVRTASSSAAAISASNAPARSSSITVLCCSWTRSLRAAALNSADSANS